MGDSAGRLRAPKALGEGDVSKLKDNWLSFLGQGVRHLLISEQQFACGIEKRARAGWSREADDIWERDDEGPACQACVQAQMRMA
jgi:hypothetical protein